MPNWKIEWFDRVDINGQERIGTPETATSGYIDMTSPPFKVEFASLIASAPPFNFINERVPMHPGSYLKFVDTEENEVELTLMIQGKWRQDLYNIIGGSATNGISLPNLFNPVKEPVDVVLENPRPGEDINKKLTGFGKLRVTTPFYNENGEQNFKENQRELICRCSSGFQIDQTRMTINHVFCPLTFYANSPFWRNRYINDVDLNTKNPPKWFGPMHGLDIGDGAPYEKKFYILNDGELPAPPIWTVYGPCVGPYFENKTTGKKLVFSKNLVIGKQQYLVINTENRTVQISGKTSSDLDKIEVTSQFWDLVPHRNEIIVRAFNSSSTVVNKNTKVILGYYRRYTGVY